MNDKLTKIIEIVEEKLKGNSFEKYNEESMIWK